jgi:hypothetical protein
MTEKRRRLKRAQKLFNRITDREYPITDISVVLLAKGLEREYRRAYNKCMKDAPLKIRPKIFDK